MDEKQLREFESHVQSKPDHYYVEELRVADFRRLLAWCRDVIEGKSSADKRKAK